MEWNWKIISFFMVLIVVATTSIVAFGEHPVFVKSKITISVPDQVPDNRLNKRLLLFSFFLLGLGVVLWLHDNNSKFFSFITFIGSMLCLWILSRGQVFKNWFYTSILVVIVLLFAYLNYGKW